MRKNKIKFKTILGNTVKGLKLNIEQANIIQADQYFLTFNNYFLYDDYVLGVVNVKNGSELFVHKREPITITIQCDGKVDYRIKLTSDYIFLDLKKYFAKLYDIDEKFLSFQFVERECNDYETLFDVGVTDTSVLNLIVNRNKIDIFASYLSKEIQIVIDKNQTIRELRKVLGNLLNIEGETFLLHFNNILLSDSSTISSCGITNNSFIEVTLPIVGGFLKEKKLRI